jgi:hypothetical protein
MVERPIGQPQKEWGDVPYKSTSVRGSKVIVIDVIYSLNHKLAHSSVPRGYVAIIIITGPLAIKNIPMTYLPCQH